MINILSKKVGLTTIALAGLIFLIPLDTYQILNRISLLRLVALVPVVICLMQIRMLRLKRSSVSFVLLVFIFLMLITTPFSYNVSSSIIWLFTFVMYTILVLIVTSYPYNENQRKYLIGSLVASSVLCLVLVIFFPYDLQGRLTIKINPLMNEDPNQFSGYLIPGLIFFYYQFLTRNIYRIISLVLFAIFGYVLLLTGSRGGILAAVIGLFVLTWLVFYGRFKSILGAGLIVGLISVALFFGTNHLITVINPEISTRFSYQDVVDSGGSGRTDIWKEDLQIFENATAARKMFGYGVGALPSLQGRVAHNSWIDMLLELGVIGLITFGALIFTVAWSLYRSKQLLLFSIFSAYIGLTMSLTLMAYKPLWIMIILTIIVSISSIKYDNRPKYG